MKAVTITKYGGVEGLEIRDIDMPAQPAADRVRVRVRAAGINRADLIQLRGFYPAPPGYPQEIPGLEFAGEVDAVGAEVRSWKPGQRVFGLIAGGGQAEYVVVPENHLTEIPSSLDWPQAAAVPEAFITAQDAIFTRGRLRMSETLLVHAAGSGVGTAAIQLARVAGATVFGSSRTAGKLEDAKSLGLTASIVVDRDPSSVVDAVRKWTNERGVDVVLDLVGGAYLDANLKSLAQMGRLILVGTTSGSKATLDFVAAMSRRLTIVGTVLRSRSNEEKATATRLFAKHVVPLLAEGRVRPIIDQVFSAKDVRAAYTRLDSNDTFGKVVLLFE
jgi:putative PIG3 family NAD(P)H quinone oxidoreductase